MPKMHQQNSLRNFPPSKNFYASHYVTWLGLYWLIPTITTDTLKKYIYICVCPQLSFEDTTNTNKNCFEKSITHSLNSMNTNTKFKFATWFCQLLYIIYFFMWIYMGNFWLSIVYLYFKPYKRLISNSICFRCSFKANLRPLI